MLRREGAPKEPAFKCSASFLIRQTSIHRAPSELRAVPEECLVPDRATDDRVFKIQNGRHGKEDCWKYDYLLAL